MYFVFIYENRRMKPFETILRSGGLGGGRGDEEERLRGKSYYKHICKYHNVFSGTTIIC
jgi:hypothetical protein